MMDSDDEDVSENDILDWYRSEVADIWDTATDSAFADLSSNFSDMFRQVMNDVKQRNQPIQTPNGYAVEVNGHSSTVVNGVHELPTADEPATNTVSVSSDQLMAMLQDDEDWLEESNTSQDEEMVLSVQLTDTPNQTEEDQKNVKGVSRETSHHPADSILMLFKTASKISTSLMKFMVLYFIFMLFALSASTSLIYNPLLQMQRWFLRYMQDNIYPCVKLLRLATLPLILFLTDLHEKHCLIPDYSWNVKNSVDCRSSCSQILSGEKKNLAECLNGYYHYFGIHILTKGLTLLEDIRKLYDNSKTGGFITNHFTSLDDFLEHPKLMKQDTRAYCRKINRSGHRFHRLFSQPRFVPLDTTAVLYKHLFVEGQAHKSYSLPGSEFVTNGVMDRETFISSYVTLL